MSFFSSTSARMKFALYDYVIIPEWRFLYYDSETLLQLTHLMEQLFFLQHKIRNDFLKLYKSQTDLYLRLNLCIHAQMKEINENFVKFHFSEKEVIFIFTQLKYLQLREKYQKFKLISSTSSQQIKIHCLKKFKVECKSALIQIKQSKNLSQEDSQNILVIWQNLYIQSLFLKKLLEFNQNQEKKVLSLHAYVVDKYYQFDAPQIIFQRQKYKKLSQNLHEQIEDYIHHKQIYSLQDSKHQNKFRSLSKSIQKSKQNLDEKDKINLRLAFFGLWCGFIIFLIFFLIGLLQIQNISLDNNLIFQNHFPIWRGLSYFIYYILAFGVSLLVLQKNQINYKVIFSIDEVLVPTAFSTLIIGSTFATIYMLFFIAYVLTISNQYFNYLPGVLWIIMLFVIFNPLPIFNWRPRLYWIKMVFFMIISPFNVYEKLDFKMNWFTQQFISFKQPFRDIAYTISFYLVDQQSSYNTSIIIGQLTIIGIIFWRILQVFKMSYDGGTFFLPGQVPVKGMFKAVPTIGAIILSLLYRISLNTNYLYAWIAFATVTTLYNYHYDLTVDWGLLEQNSQHKFLANLITFKPRVYYIIMVLNFILRLAWIFNISTGIINSFSVKPYIFIMIISYLELTRRAIWNVLKIQRQHLRSCQKFQAVVNYKYIQESVKKNVFQKKIEQYSKNIEALYCQINKFQKEIKNDKFIICEIQNRPYMKFSDPEQIRKIVERRLLLKDQELDEKRSKQLICLLMQKLDLTKVNCKNMKHLIQQKKKVIKEYELIIMNEKLSKSYIQ